MKVVPLLAVVLVGMGAGPVPATRPTRDVVGLYEVSGQALELVPGGLKGPVRLSWDAAGQRLRAEAAGRTQVALLDLRSHSGEAFDTTLRIALPLKVRERDLQPLTLEGVQLVPRGRQVVAGLGCTTYAYDGAQGRGTVCLTADGVPLKGEGTVQGRPGSFVATAVTYGALPEALFVVPPGYVALGGAGGLGGLADRLGGSSPGGSGLGDLRGLLGRLR